MMADESGSVGKRIKSARQKRELCIEDVAKSAGCSDEYLEWVEDDQVQPPVALLIRLAKALQLDSSVFLSIHSSPHRRLEEATKRTEHYSYKTLTPPEAESHLMAFSVTIPPKTAHDGVGYCHEGEEFIYVLAGEVEITVDRKKIRLTAKESIRFNSNLDHNISNPGDNETEMLVILYTP